MDHTYFHALFISLAIATAVYFFLAIIRRKYALLTHMQAVPDPIGDHGHRLKEILTIFLGQKKLFQEFRPGIMHAIIFWGFLILLLRAITLFGMLLFGYNAHLPLLGSNMITGRFYSLVKDAANIGVLMMVAYAAVRRYILKIPRLLNTPGAAFVLGMIATLMITDMLFDTALHVARATGPHWYAPVASILSPMFTTETNTLSASGLIIGQISILLHCAGILAFLVYLPMGKHMHIITSIFNVYLRPLSRTGRLTKLDLEDESIESFGIESMEDHTWKDVLDMYSCTECGRCNEQCPAYQTGKTLAPREITRAENHFLQDEDAGRILGEITQTEPVKPLVPEVVGTDEIWECTTCHACEQACPVNIGYVHRIIGLRRGLNLNHGEFPKELRKAFKGMENNSNPWNLGSSTRGDWMADLDIPLFAENPNAEYLLFIGCAGSFDDRAIKISRAMIKLLNMMNVSYGVLGADESCCGETARRLGEESLGQMLTEANIELFSELGVKKIVTICPHCFNTFKNEYPDFGGNYEVIHHSQLLSQWVENNPVFPDELTLDRIVVHDSCYMGRVNGEYDAPRRIIRSIKGLVPVEPEKTGP
ncbi:MAG TPA: (Fe-S)-binding protein, partial [bacterium]|nr:(Fe-S)-binding protein [bacterium]